MAQPIEVAREGSGNGCEFIGPAGRCAAINIAAQCIACSQAPIHALQVQVCDAALGAQAGKHRIRRTADIQKACAASGSHPVRLEKIHSAVKACSGQTHFDQTTGHGGVGSVGGGREQGQYGEGAGGSGVVHGTGLHYRIDVDVARCVERERVFGPVNRVIDVDVTSTGHRRALAGKYGDIVAAQRRTQRSATDVAGRCSARDAAAHS